MTKQEIQLSMGENLRRCRVAQGLTIDQLSEKVDISTTYYSNLEHGNRMMSVETMWKLTEALSVSADALMRSDRPDGRMKNIELLLRDQTPEELAVIEELIRFWIAHR